MRILFISNFYPPYELGGYEQWCAEVAAGLMARGHEIKILTSNYGVGPGQPENTSFISRTLHLQSDVSYYRPLDFFLYHGAEEKDNLRILAGELDRFRPDLVMIWGMWNMSLNLPSWAEQKMADRVAYFISNYWPTDIDAHSAYWNLPANQSVMRPLKSLMRSYVLTKLRSENYPPHLEFKKAVCCSNYVRNRLVESGKLPEHAGVLLGGIDTDSFFQYSRLKEIQPDQHGNLRLLYFGRLIHDKGVHTAIQAIGILKRKNLADNLHLTILGSGHPSYETYLRELVKTMDVEEHVEFIKKIPRNEIPKWLALFDVFLFTSIWPEPMARSVMEAMAAGLLVIGTDVGGQAEMLSNGINSLTFKPEDAETLANHILSVRDDWSRRVMLASEGQNLVLEKFTIERMVNEIEQFLRDVVQST